MAAILKLMEDSYVDITPGFNNVPASAWAGATPEGVMGILLSHLPEDVDTKNLSLGQILRLQEPAHKLLGTGHFEPGGSFETAIELMPPELALGHFYTVRKAYCSEAWLKGDTEHRAAIELFNELEQTPQVQTLHEIVYPPKRRLRDRILGRLTIGSN